MYLCSTFLNNRGINKDQTVMSPIGIKNPGKQHKWPSEQVSFKLLCQTTPAQIITRDSRPRRRTVLLTHFL